MEIYEKLLYLFLTILVTALFGSIIPRKLKERERFIEAAAEFRTAFIEERRLLDPHSSADRASAGSASSIIKNAIDCHESAMIRFEPFVCKSKIKKYTKAWREYAGDGRNFEEYTGDNFDKKEKGRALALNRINNLLKFTEP
jgi:hypothetical protein